MDVGRVMRRVAVVVVLLLAVTALAAGGLVASITAGGQPPLSGTVRVPGLRAPVSIVRDVDGVAQVMASNTHDLFYAQGWLHASERMWQMEIWRRAGAGRLAELFGPSQVDTDRLLRTVGIRAAAERDLAALSPETIDVLDAYADGVNAYIDGHPGALGLAWVIAGFRSGLGDGLAGLRPEPWTPLDTAAWAKLQAWGLADNADSEIFRMIIDDRLGDPALTDQLTPPYAPGAPVIAAAEVGETVREADAAAGATGAAADAIDGMRSGDLSASRFPRRAGQAADVDASAWADVGRLVSSLPAAVGLTPDRGLFADGGVGSNNWVVAPSRSATGTALLANDPHLGLSMPSVWYVNGLHCRPVSDACPYDVAGVSFPGTPGVTLGHNARIAWGATNANPDVQDLFLERLDPSDPGRYLTPGGSQPFVVRHETIQVAGGDPVEIEIRETRHGPILNDVDERLAGDDRLLALRWTGLIEPDPILDGFLALNRAGSFDEFRAALRSFNAPAQNFVYAGVDGHIGYQLPGYVPVRQDPADLGLRPVPGWDGRHEWIGKVPYDDLPTVLDPPSGRIVTANNPIDAGDVYLGSEFDRGDRAARILQLLDEAGDGVTLDVMAAIQRDDLLRRAARLAAGLLSVRPVPATEDGAAVLDGILAWDGHCTTESLGCSAYVTFEFELERALFDDDLGAEAPDYLGSGYSEDFTASLLATPEGRAAPWWGDIVAGTWREPAEVVAEALDTAGAALRRDAGDPSAWTWGRIHRVTFREPVFGSTGIGPLDWYFDPGTMAVGGAAGAVNNTGYLLRRAYPDPTDSDAPVVDTLQDLFAVTAGPSMRALYDMGDLDAGRILTSTGQSGQPFSSHADDWVVHWVRGETVPLPFTDAAIDASRAATLTLEPA